MKDVIHSLLKVVDHERYKLLGLCLGVMSVVSMIGCDIAIRSPFSGEKVTRQAFKLEAVAAELDLESEQAQLKQAQLTYNNKVELHNEQKAAGEEEFVKKEKLQEGFLEIVGGAAVTVVSGGQVNMAQALIAMLSLGGLGTAVGGVADSARKNKVIKDEKAKNGTVVASGGTVGVSTV